MNAMKKQYLAAAFAALATPVWAGYEDVGLGSRPMGMGGAFVAMADDANALYWNPAGMVHVKRQQALFMHGLYGGVTGVNFDYLAYIYPLQDMSLGFGWSQTGVTLEEGDGASAVSSRFSEDIYYISAGVRPSLFGSDSLSVGGTLKRLTLDSKVDSGSGMGFDLGAQFRPTPLFQLGFAMRNVATDVRNEKYPASMRLGLASRLVGETLRIAVDLSTKEGIDSGNATAFRPHVGLEYQPLQVFALRLGWEDGGYTVGAGFEYSSIRLDYGYRANELVGNVHRVSLGASFGPGAEPQAAAPKPVAKAPVAKVKALEVTKDESGSVSSYRLGASLAFEKNSSNLSTDGVDTLRTLVSDLEKNPKQRIEILGYSDNSGTASLNREVTQARANSVEKVLVDLGLAPKRIAKVKGMGEVDPIASNDNEEGQAQNRRVEFKVVK